MTLCQPAPGNARIDEFINTSRRRRELTKEEPRLRKLTERDRLIKDPSRSLDGFELGLSPEEPSLISTRRWSVLRTGDARSLAKARYKKPSQVVMARLIAAGDALDSFRDSG